MPANALPFDAVLLDLDGTLVATERFWPRAAREGALRAFRELGLARDPPTTAQWLGLVGQRLTDGFCALFPDLDDAARERVLAACVEEEHRALAAGGASFVPGAERALDELAARGVRLGVASNCSQSYLDAITSSLGLARWITESRCLHSRGVRDKADMIADLLATFETRSAVMVGDRASDRDAAWANGIPHVHVAGGFAGADERVECEATIEGLDELVERLERRSVAIARVREALALPAASAVIGVTGDPGAGKTLFARDLARDLTRALARPALVVALADFARTDASAESDPLAAQLARHDLDALLQTVLRPYRRGESAVIERVAPDELVPGLVRRVRIEIPAGAILVLEGPALLHPRLAVHLDRCVWIGASEATSLRRLAGRDARLAGPRVLERAHAIDLPAARAISERYPPVRHASVVLDGESALEPALAEPSALVDPAADRAPA